MLEQQVGKVFLYKKLTEEEQKSRGILGRLVGIIADTERPTRNERRYSKKLWDNVFSDPIMIEKIKNKCCFGELNHPADVAEVDIKLVAVSLAEVPKRGEDGRLYGVFDILSTPNGKILKTLCDYGSKLGISSRGSGDIIEDEQGNEEVDPDTYNCECFDIVIVPGVEAARPLYTTESLHIKSSNTLKHALKESLSVASDNDRVIMENTLKNRLNINLIEEADEKKHIEAVDNPSSSSANDIAECDNVKECENQLVSSVISEEDNNDIVDYEVADEVTDDNMFDSSVDKNMDTESEISYELSDEDNNEEIVSDKVEDDISFETPESTEDDNLKEESDEDIFLRFLTSNFTEKQIDKVCKVLDIDLDDLDDRESDDEEDSNESEEEINDIANSEDSLENIESDEEAEDEEDSNEHEKEEDEADDDGSDALVSSLKETLKQKSDLENIVKALQEKLAVSDAKVDNTCRERDRYKSAVTRLSIIAKSAKDLRESVSKLETSASKQEKLIKVLKQRIHALAAEKTEGLEKSNQIAELNESISKNTSKYKAEIQLLQEAIESTKTSTATEINNLTKQLNESNRSKESYKNLANKVVNKYIEAKADSLGVDSRDIKRRLGESYTLEDVDKTCESLRAYRMNIRKLPFNVDSPVSIKISESVSRSKSVYEDDSVDDGLLKLASTNF